MISGTPTASGTSTFTVEVTGTGSPVPTATEQFSVTVASAPVTTPAAAKPMVRLLGHSGLVKGNRLGVKLRCSKARCAGKVKLEAREVVTVKRGKKKARKHRTHIPPGVRSARDSVVGDRRPCAEAALSLWS